MTLRPTLRPHNPMTWDQFKQAVDEQLHRENKDGSIEIAYIDVSHPYVIDAWIDEGVLHVDNGWKEVGY